jgi:hypothetical protein
MTDFESLDAGAVFDGPSMDGLARTIRPVRKCGGVGAPALPRAMIEGFGPVSPVSARTFDLSEQANAWAWVGAASQ